MTKKDVTYLVFEYLEHDLLGLSSVCINYDLSMIKCIMKQIAEGLFYLHGMNILHRDLKRKQLPLIPCKACLPPTAANILMSGKGVLKIADFGLSRFNNATSNLSNRVVTLWYRAPELLYGSTRYTNKIDMWSLGCIFAELLVGFPLFAGKTSLFCYSY